MRLLLYDEVDDKLAYQSNHQTRPRPLLTESEVYADPPRKFQPG
jgi:hypothetical protein